MFNSRDSYTDFNPNKKTSIELPYSIGTVVELNENPNILAEICQYRIVLENHRQIIYVGLCYEKKRKSTSEENKVTSNYSFNIPNKSIATAFSDSIEFEITTEELERKWKKTDKIIIGKLEHENFILIGMPNEEPLFQVLTEEINEPVKTLKK